MLAWLINRPVNQLQRDNRFLYVLDVSLNCELRFYICIYTHYTVCMHVFETLALGDLPGRATQTPQTFTQSAAATVSKMERTQFNQVYTGRKKGVIWLFKSSLKTWVCGRHPCADWMHNIIQTQRANSFLASSVLQQRYWMIHLKPNKLMKTWNEAVKVGMKLFNDKFRKCHDLFQTWFQLCRLNSAYPICMCWFQLTC